VPSVVGVGETDLGLLSLGALGRRRRSRQPDQVTFDKITYLVGEGVARYARPVERMDFLRLWAVTELRALFYDILFRLLG
jgi:MYXO-CTERM domain-containing protein